ncbi:hypothetical protein K435DRAFT_796608 [Dendrothele bispora CBS 962.96]|uniref:Uncharacterized protein n=1 Tax=Dendrothele bispora (strain CBS 962.96) TaxID=1314807 RepID=A0A4S8M515_DENBC|nr:hypothetical protein K435DRAFT_796608 [Dendrothele bispora CBS 962.96]
MFWTSSNTHLLVPNQLSHHSVLQSKPKDTRELRHQSVTQDKARRWAKLRTGHRTDEQLSKVTEGLVLFGTEIEMPLVLMGCSVLTGSTTTSNINERGRKTETDNEEGEGNEDDLIEIMNEKGATLKDTTYTRHSGSRAAKLSIVRGLDTAFSS